MKKAALSLAKFFIITIFFIIGAFFVNVGHTKAQSANNCDPNKTDNKDNKGNTVVCVSTKEQADDQTQNAADTCNNDAGGLSIIICPLIDAANKGIAALTIGGDGQVAGKGRQSILISFLELPPLQARDPNNPTVNSPLVQVVNQLITVANVIYVLVFLVLIFASSLPFNIDNYTVKKMLPKLIAAVILTQFSVFICGIIIDFFNLLGLIIPNILLNVGKISIDNGAGSSLAQQVGGAVGQTILFGGFLLSGIGWIIILIISIVALISVILATIYLLIRYFLLYLLILISPFAFVAWVFPGTSKYFTGWWQNFIRLNAMFATIMALMSSSIVLSRVLANTPNAPAPIKWVGSLLPMIALLLIPKTLKATTSGMNKLAAGALNYAGGKAAGYSKQAGSAAYKKGKQLGNEARKNVALNQFGKNESGWKRKAAILAGGKLPTAKGERDMEREFNKKADEAKSDEAINLNNATQDQARARAATVINGLDPKNRNAKSIGQAQAVVERLTQTGDVVGLAQAKEDYYATQSAQLANSGLSQDQIDSQISNGWYEIMGSNAGAIKEMSPSLADTNMRLEVSQTASDASAYGGHAAGKEYVKQKSGDFSKSGEDKLAAMDPEMLKSIVSSIHEGHASVGDFKFDRNSMESLLTNPNSRFKSAETRQALQTIAASNGWKYK